MPDLLSIAGLLQSFVTIFFGAALVWFATRYWKRHDAGTKAQEDATARLTTRNDAADTERLALRADSETNKAQHTRFQLVNEDLREVVRRMEEKLHAVELAVLRNDTRHEATKEALARIDGQLSMLLSTIRNRA